MTGMTCPSSCTRFNERVYIPEATCAKCSHASPIIPLTASSSVHA
jgi:hypothetical protein